MTDPALCADGCGRLATEKRPYADNRGTELVCDNCGDRMSRRQYVMRQLGTYAHVFFGVNFAAGWALVLAQSPHGHFLPWPLYPLGAVYFLHAAVARQVEDATKKKHGETE